jgi:hypothetical protein
MPQDAPPNGSARVPAWDRVAGMQAKLHRWAAADPGRRFDDLFNLHVTAVGLDLHVRATGEQPGHQGRQPRRLKQRAFRCAIVFHSWQTATACCPGPNASSHAPSRTFRPPGTR